MKVEIKKPEQLCLANISLCYFVSGFVWVILSISGSNMYAQQFLSKTVSGLDGAQWVLLFMITIFYGLEYLKGRQRRTLICCLSTCSFLLLSIVVQLSQIFPSSPFLRIGRFLYFDRTTIVSILMTAALSLYPMTLATGTISSNRRLNLVLFGAFIYWLFLNFVLVRVLLFAGLNSYLINAAQDLLNALCFAACFLSAWADR